MEILHHKVVLLQVQAILTTTQSIQSVCGQSQYLQAVEYSSHLGNYQYKMGINTRKLICLFPVLWLPAEKGLTSWLSCVCCFLVFLSLSHMVSWVRCGTGVYRFLIFACFLVLVFLTRGGSNQPAQLKSS